MLKVGALLNLTIIKNKNSIKTKNEQLLLLHMLTINYDDKLTASQLNIQMEDLLEAPNLMLER